jgi:hypothetical protein
MRWSLSYDDGHADYRKLTTTGNVHCVAEYGGVRFSTFHGKCLD